MKYYATFKANGGSTYNAKPYEYTNKASAIRDIRSIVYSNHLQQPCNRSTYCVYDGNGICIASGALNDRGWWSVNREEIGTKICDAPTQEED